MNNRRNFLKMLGFGGMTAIPGATLLGNEMLKEAAKRACVDPDIVKGVMKLDAPIPASDLDPHVSEYWAKESLRMLQEQQEMSRDFDPKITDDGVEYALDRVYTGRTDITDWHVGLIDDVNFTGLHLGDNLNDHAGWDDLGFDLVKLNGDTVEFECRWACTAKGGYIASPSKGIIWSSWVFPVAARLTNGDTLKIDLAKLKANMSGRPISAIL